MYTEPDEKRHEKSDSDGWICTSHPFDQDSSAVLETTDGGQTWSEYSAPFPGYAIHMIDSDTGYFGCFNGMIYKTTNGAKSWTYHGHLLAPLYTIGFPPRPAKNGYAGGKNGHLAIISPEGVTPVDLGLAGNAYCIQFPSVERGYAILDYQMIIYYMDEAWHVEASYPYAGKGWLYFLNDTLGWCVGDRFLKTEVGIDWYTTSTNTVLTGPLTGVFFNDQHNGWATGTNGQIYYTSDGGTVWNHLPHDLTDGFLNGVYFTSPNNGFIYGGEKILLKYGAVNGLPESGRKNNITIAPNPVTSKFSVHRPEAGIPPSDLKLAVTDLFGKVVAENRNPEDNTFDISHLPSGFYFLRVETRREVRYLKVIKR